MPGLTDGEVFNNCIFKFTPSGSGEIDLTLYTRSLTFNRSRGELDNTRMGHFDKSRKKGPGEWEFTVKLINQFGAAQGGVDVNLVLWTELAADTIGALRFRPFNAAKSLQNPEWTGPCTLFNHGFGGDWGILMETTPVFKSGGTLVMATS